MRFNRRGLARRAALGLVSGLLATSLTVVITATPTQAALEPPQATFAANRTQPIVFTSGYLGHGTERRNVNGDWGLVKDALTSWGWQANKLGGVALYNCDHNFTWNTNNYPTSGLGHHGSLGGLSYEDNHATPPESCGSPFDATPPSTLHSRNTSIEHLAYHWAWTIKEVFPTTCVKVLSHSMGGLMARYALARMSQGDPEFPSGVCIEDVVTMATPHNGSPLAEFPTCVTYQCVEMREGSFFLQWLGANAPNPQGPGGTDWTAMGSPSDDTAPTPSSTTANFKPARAVTYEEGIEHSDIPVIHPLHWKSATQSEITANTRWIDETNGWEQTTQDGPWPIRYADMSLAYNQWGCGVGNTTSAFPLTDGVATVGEPYTTSSDCWYAVDVGASRRLNVTMTSLNNHDLDLSLHYPLPSSTPTCTAATINSTETCNVPNAGLGRWYIKVRNFAATRDPFTIKALVQDDCATGGDAGDAFATATAITVPKTNCTGFLSTPVDREDWYSFNANLGDRVTATMSPNNSADFNLCVYGPSGGPAAACSTNGPGLAESVSVVAGTSGTWRVQVSRTDPPYATYSLSMSVITPQNDCSTGGDAGNSSAGATSLTLPKTNCTGQLRPGEGDSDDYYKFKATNGQTINASMTPNATSNFDICIYNSAGSLVSGCTSGTTGGTDTLSYAVMATGEYRLRVKVTSGTGSYTMSVSLAGLVIRRDDDERDTSMPLDLNDDVANKRLPVVPADVSGKTTATLYVLGQAYGCTGAPPGNKFTLKANGNLVANVNPCNDWSTSGYSWKAYNVPLSWLVFGENTFRYDHISGSGDHLTRNVNLAIDSDTDVGASDTNVNSGSEVPGELMWYLVLN